MNNLPTIYKQHGYANREVYLEALADEYGMPLCDVKAVADLLGPTEDFDGLVSFLSD